MQDIKSSIFGSMICTIFFSTFAYLEKCPDFWTSFNFIPNFFLFLQPGLQLPLLWRKRPSDRKMHLDAFLRSEDLRIWDLRTLIARKACWWLTELFEQFYRTWLKCYCLYFNVVSINNIFVSKMLIFFVFYCLWLWI